MPQPVSPVLKNNKDSEIVFAKDQPEYIPLPSLISEDSNGIVTSRWFLSWRERLVVLFRGSIYLQIMTFHDPPQPSKILVLEPKPEECL